MGAASGCVGAMNYIAPIFGVAFGLHYILNPNANTTPRWNILNIICVTQCKLNAKIRSLLLDTNIFGIGNSKWLRWMKENNVRLTQMIEIGIFHLTLALPSCYPRIPLVLLSRMFVLPCIFHYQRMLESWWNMGFLLHVYLKYTPQTFMKSLIRYCYHGTWGCLQCHLPGSPKTHW